MDKKFEQLAINTIRTLSMDAVQEAGSGHPGAPMGMAPVAFTLYDKHLRFNPANPNWMNRDRFILSAGHASMLLYSVLHINGFDISLADIKNFRQLHSKCAGHPEYDVPPGVETTTGPLGQGAATSVGTAIAEKWLANHFNKPGYELFDYHIFALAGDGCMMEGITSEAASLAGHLGLDNLTWIYDNNSITIEGNTSLAFSEDVALRFEAFGWSVYKISDANATTLLDKTLHKAKKEKGKPSLLIVDSHIAFGAPNKQDTHGSHGAPLGEDEIRATKAYYGWDPDKKFFIPEEINSYTQEVVKRGADKNNAWNKTFDAYKIEYPELAAQLELMQRHELPAAWDEKIPSFEQGTSIATRSANGKVLNALAGNIPFFMGGSADLAPSTKTKIESEESFSKHNYNGRNLHYGIRENAMGAIANGLALSGLRNYASTFLVFSDYAKPSIRLSAIMKLPVTYIFTHDSIGVGEDGPTHQPVEHLAALRAIPNLEVIRPADANEVSVLWKYILKQKDKPTALILSRQSLPVIDREKYEKAYYALKGGYVVAGKQEQPDAILLATGSEVHLALEAYEKLKAENINVRVVSMPNWSLFDRQSQQYKASVLPEDVKNRLAIEAGSPTGWHKYIGMAGKLIGMTSFGASGKITDLLEEFGFTVENIVKETKKLCS